MKQFLRKCLALLTAISLLAQNFIPQKTYALTGGPNAPEFSNFESVSTSNMVDPFTGDFTYNIPILEVPGPNGGGYPVSLSYHSGLGPEEEASWVGFGWTLNAGAISRNKNGFPDDADGDKQISINKVEKNSTWTASTDLGASMAFNIGSALKASHNTQKGIDALTNLKIGGGLDVIWSHNNHSGSSFKISPYGYASAAAFSCNISMEDGEERYTQKIDPAYWVSSICRIYTDGQGNGLGFQSISDGINVGISKIFNKYSSASYSPFSNKAYTLYNNSMPSVLQDYTGCSWSVNVGARLYYGVIVPVGVSLAETITHTFQKPANDGISAHDYYGYMHSANATGKDDLMDYTIEKNDPYNMRDQFLPIPYSAADQFSVSGEGVGGVFKANCSSVGFFRPNQQNSHTTIASIGAELAGPAPLSFTASASIGTNVDDDDAPTDPEAYGESAAEAIIGGGHTLSVKSWTDAESADYNFSAANNNAEPFYFRFLGDMGGSSSYHDDDNLFSKDVCTAKLKNTGNNEYTPYYASNTNLYAKVNNTGEVKRASYIGYHTNQEMSDAYNRYSFRNDDSLASGFTRSTGTKIGEFEVTNTNGAKYLYSLPVYAQNEKEIAIGISTTERPPDNFFVEKDLSALDDYFNDITADNDQDNTPPSYNIVGSIRDTKYPASYLLTQVTQPNYIDVDNDGPDKDDIGGWTTFNYEKYKDAFKWRSPYYGLLFNPGKLSDPLDDIGSFSCGEKEIYYLNTIETATHIAVFTTSEREDGVAAESYEKAGKQYSTSSLTKLKKLDQITLYAKDSDGNKGEVIKRIYFKYDYSAWPGVTNNINASTSDADKTTTGKLTLKKIYVEYENVSNATISPYTFEYTYPQTDYPTNTEYAKNTSGAWVATGNDIYSSLEDVQKLSNEPNYEMYASDRWGSYRENGSTLSTNMFPWVDQTPSTTFDPAAWQLKQITLPTGGEIHVQYEQDDYQYVQDRKAMAMVKLSGSTSDYDISSSSDYSNDAKMKYYVDLSTLGIESDETSVKKMQDYIQKIMIDGYNGRKPELAYFKFLYNITASSALALDNYNNEFIDGYVRVTSVNKEGPDASGKYKLSVNLGYKSGESLAGANEGEWVFPREACTEFFQNNRGNTSLYTDAGGNIDELNVDNTDENTTAWDIVSEGYEIVSQALKSQTEGYYGTVCKVMDPDNSYLRLPLPYEKKGGGLRVKRLITYDPGIEDNDSDGKNDDAAVYGHEYLYIDYDGNSSGVATNEPSTGRIENALIGYLHKREESSDQQKMAAGEDRSQFEGPLGEYTLSAPSVGYSRVLVRNIYSGTTHDGINTFEYYTTKDYPFDKTYKFTDPESNETVKYKGASHSNLNYETASPCSWLFVVINSDVDAWATQGYRFILNSMNGQMKKQTMYSGKWENYNHPDSLQEVSSSTYQYFEPGEPVPALDKDGGVSYIHPGASSEVVIEEKEIADESAVTYLSIEIGTTTTVPPIPFVIPMVYQMDNNNYIYTHVTTQTDYYPPIVKSVKTYQDGAYSTVSNLYYDATSGNPIVTSRAGIYDNMAYATDGGTTANQTYHDKCYSYNIPATYYYDEMGQKAGCEGYSFSGGTVTATKYTSGDHYTVLFTGSGYQDVLNYFSAGDLIVLNKEGSSTKEIYNVGSVSSIGINIYPSTNFSYSTSSSYEVEIEILQSGRANMLGLSAGNITSIGDAFEGLSDSSWDHVLGATANTYKNTADISDDIKDKYNISTISNIVETGEAGKWALNANYVYKTDLVNDDMALLSGELEDFSEFDWDDVTSISNKWLRTDSIDQYAPDGNALESENILGIHSAVKFGYGNSLPYLTAANANYGSVHFEGFEYQNSGGCGEDYCFEEMGVSEHFPTTDFAHTGLYALQLYFSTTTTSDGGRVPIYTHTHNSELNISDFKTRTDQEKENGISVKIWVKSSDFENQTYTLRDGSAYDAMSNINGDVVEKSTATAFSDVSFTQVARTGEWALYEAKITGWTMSAATDPTYSLEITVTSSSTSGSATATATSPTVYVDDIRIQPLDTKMNCYVYDPATYKVVASLDDQNFALIYQYNDEGKLIRKQKETIRGVKTLVETQYNIPTQSR